MYCELDSTHSEKEWDDFNNHLEKGPVMILFYMNGCPYCEGMKNQWDLFTSNNKLHQNNVPIYRVLKDVQHKLPNEITKHVSGYPTILSANKNELLSMYPENLKRNEGDFHKFYNSIEHEMKNRENKKDDTNIYVIGGKKRTYKKKKKKHMNKKTHKRKKIHKKKKKIHKKKKTHKKKKYYYNIKYG